MFDNTHFTWYLILYVVQYMPDAYVHGCMYAYVHGCMYIWMYVHVHGCMYMISLICKVNLD